MLTFQCSCSKKPILFFESTECTVCKRLAGFSDVLNQVLAFEPTDTEGVYQADIPAGGFYRQCQNYRDHQVCNGMISIGDNTADQSFCFACHFNETIPDLGISDHLSLWRKLEVAKRRTFFTLNALDLDIPDRQQNPTTGLFFRFITDKDATDHFRTSLPGQDPVFTGHNNGEIIINFAEADDVARARTKLSMGEQYRTLLGHFRHEIGHFYWDQLIGNDPGACQQFRDLFGDESADYQEALDRHYQQGPPADWHTSFVSAYASMHPLEDWAESWAHYLHIVDTLETAQSFGLQLENEQQSTQSAAVTHLVLPQDASLNVKNTPIETILNTWMGFTVMLNSLNRSMGLEDAYPFVLYPLIREKLSFIHTIVIKVLDEMES